AIGRLAYPLVGPPKATPQHGALDSHSAARFMSASAEHFQQGAEFLPLRNRTEEPTMTNQIPALSGWQAKCGTGRAVNLFASISGAVQPSGQAASNSSAWQRSGFDARADQNGIKRNA